MSARFHLVAWGSPDHPDLDQMCDDYPSDLSSKYPYVQIALLHSVSAKDLRDNLYEKTFDE